MNNKNKIVKVLRGLPASGKSTIAKNLIQDPSWIRVNNDDFRSMMGNDRKWNKKDEELITKVRESIIHEALLAGYNIVLDNLNLHPKHIEWIENKLKQFPEYSLEVIDVLCEPEICSIRDSQREKPVGDKVIFDWYHKYLETKVPKRVQSLELQKCLVFDIDGTLANHEGVRSCYDYTKVLEDKPIQWVLDILNKFRDTHKIIFASGRKNVCESDTRKWIDKYIWNPNDEVCVSIYTPLTDYELYMRKADDERKDYIIKKEIYEEFILPRYHVDFVVDDRLQVVRMLRNSLSLNVLQVDDGLF